MNENADTITPDAALTKYIENEKQKFSCTWPHCTKSFDSPIGLRMHRIRAHISPWSTTKNFRGKGTGPRAKWNKTYNERKKQQRAVWDKRYREKLYKRLKDQGVTMRKTPRKTRQFASQTEAYRKRKYREMVDRYHAAGLNAHGQPYKDSAITRGQLKARGLKVPHRRFAPYVYPVPQEPEETPVQTPEPPKVPNEVSTYIRAQLMKHCPNCGHDLQGWERKV